MFLSVPLRAMWPSFFIFYILNEIKHSQKHTRQFFPVFDHQESEALKCCIP